MNAVYFGDFNQLHDQIVVLARAPFRFPIPKPLGSVETSVSVFVPYNWVGFVF